MNSNFGNFLKEKRREKNLTQKDLAEKLFVSESAVSKWEKNIAHPDITLLPKLSEILETTEHELITASVDNKLRSEKIQAKKWRTLSFSWSLFFYISYVLALIPCFICNLAIDKTLSWFWIVVSALRYILKLNATIQLKSRVYVLLCLFTFNTTPIADMKTTSEVLPAEMNGSGSPVGGTRPDMTCYCTDTI